MASRGFKELVGAWALFFVALGSPLLADDAESDVAAFNSAYLAYEADAESADYLAAAEHARTALGAGRVLFGERTEEVRMLTFNLGLMLSLSGDEEPAYDRLEDALEMTEYLHDRNSAQMVPIYEQLERVANNLGRNRDQRAFAKREVDLTARYFGRRSVELADAAQRAGQAFASSDPRQANRYFERAYAAARGDSDSERDIRESSASSLGSHAYNDDDLEEAEKWLLRSVAELDPDRDEMSDMELRTRRELVGVYERTNRGELATEHCLAVGMLRPAMDVGSMHLLYTGEGPMYPQSAVARNRTGTVVTRFTIDAEGRVHDPVLVSDNRTRDFGAFMLKRVLEFRFAPQVVDGKPVATEGFEFTTNFGFE